MIGKEHETLRTVPQYGEDGYEWDHKDGGQYKIVTRKSLAGLKGDTVWLIAGEGRNPRRFTLRCLYIISAVENAIHPEFRNAAVGYEGQTFLPPIAIGDLDWFKKLYKATANFSMGFSRINYSIVEGMLDTVEDAGYPSAL